MTEERVLCYSEDRSVATDLVRLSRALLTSGGGRVMVLAPPGSPPESVEELARSGAHSVHTVKSVPASEPHVLAEMLRAVIGELAPTLVLVGGTKRGREVAGRLAGALVLPAVTGVTGLHLDGETLRVDREALSGNAVAVERIVRRPAIVAVLPGTTTAAVPAGTDAERREHSLALPAPLTEPGEIRAKAGGQLELEKAERVVTIGRGLKRKEDVPLIETLAKAMGAEVGCTRPLAAELGWFTDDHWIGLTGHRVHPKLYVAVGVSGAVQHLVGMRSSQIVVAINSDPNAPIFAQADYSIKGDLYQIVPALTKVFNSHP